MPHLALAGLSEQWLLQHTGDVHWALLAEGLGAPSGGWVDREGRRLYASFIAFESQGALLFAATEGCRLECHSQLWAAGANRHASLHRLRSADGVLQASLWLVSSFVRRDGGTNRVFSRAMPGTGDGWIPGPGTIPAPAANLMRVRRELRLDATTRGHRAPAQGLRVCAMEDYNTLRMIYFANFPRLLDRAERAHRFGVDGAYSSVLPPLRARRCLYYGNADGGDALRAEVDASERGSAIHLWGGNGLLCIAHSTREAGTSEVLT